MPKTKDEDRFDGHLVSGIEFELTGGGTHATKVKAKDGDIVEVTVRAKVVNVKHPWNGEGVKRLQTFNVVEAKSVKLIETYTPPPELPFDDEVSARRDEKGGGEKLGDLPPVTPDDA